MEGGSRKASARNWLIRLSFPELFPPSSAFQLEMSGAMPSQPPHVSLSFCLSVSLSFYLSVCLSVQRFRFDAGVSINTSILIF